MEQLENQNYYGTEHKGPGMDHIGFKVESLKTFKKEVKLLSKADPEWLAPKSPNLASISSPTPEGNLIDVYE